TEMRDILKSLSPRELNESYHDALQRKEEAYSMFKLGYLSLEDRAKVESLYWKLCLEIQKMLPAHRDVSEDLREMVKTLNDQYLCNFSLFQSLPDSWAIGHLFPIMPLHRLDEEPTRHAALVDITCDSDGRIGQYIRKRKVEAAIPLHPMNGEPYYLGIFLTGAYQATMGDIHNLFGRVNEVHVFEDPEEPNGYYLEEIILGETVRDVLADIQYSEFELVKMVKGAIDSQVKAGTMKPREGVELLDQYEAVLKEYTYINHNGRPATAGSAAHTSAGAAEPVVPASVPA